MSRRKATEKATEEKPEKKEKKDPKKERKRKKTPDSPGGSNGCPEEAFTIQPDQPEVTVLITLVAYETYTIGEPVTASITIADYVEGIFKDSFEEP